MIKPGFIVGAKPFAIDELFAEFSQTDQNASTILDELFAELSWADGGSVVDELFAEMAIEYAAAPALEGYSDVAAAYSLRKIVPTYTGSAIRVRRSSDNAELDIPFCHDPISREFVLCTWTLSNFVGANSAFVTTWYDQSTNARHAVQTTAANQPRIVNAGVIDSLNGRQALGFLGSQFLLAGGTRFGDTIDFSACSVFRRNDTNGVNRTLWGNRISSGRILRTTLATAFYANINAGTPAALSYTNGTAVVHSVKMQTGEVRHRINGGTDSSGFASYITGASNMYIGQAGNLEIFIGEIPELVFFDVTITDTDRQKLERNQGRFFGIAVA
jgi:hypothetical protein